MTHQNHPLKFAFIILLFSFLAISHALSSSEPSIETLKKEIHEFTVVDEHLSRGAQPTEKALDLLKAFGVRTIISFRDEKDVNAWEEKQAAALGLNFVNFPWRMQSKPKASLMKQFLELVAQKEKGPFFMHCKRGVERTGVADALYRFYHKKLSYNEAYREAMEGHDRLLYWRPYTRKRYRDFIKELGPALASS